MKRKPSILRVITFWILVSVVTAFVVSTIAFYIFTTYVSRLKTQQLLSNNIEDLHQEILEADSIVFTSSAISSAYNIERGYIDDHKTDKELNKNFVDAAEQSQVPELFLVDSTGIVRNANLPALIGYDMHSSELSRPFLRLLTPSPTCLSDTAYVTPLYPRGLLGDAPRKYVAARFFNHPGFLVVGLSEDKVVANMNFMMSNSSHYRRVGEWGSLYIFDNHLNVVSAPNRCQARSMTEVGIDSTMMRWIPETPYFTTDIMGEPSCCLYSYLMGYHLLAVQPASESTANRDAALRSRTITGGIVFMLLFAVIWFSVHRLVKGLNRINTSLARITDGDLHEQIRVDDTIEFEQLSERINQMVGRLKEYIHEAEHRIADDLALAKAIQSSTLPSVFPAFPERQEIDIHALMKTAKEVGGDFYDFFFVGENKLALVIADVAGKGIPAAMFMMRSKSALKDRASTGLPITQVCNEVNSILCQANDTNTFFTCWIGVIDLKSGLLTYVNAGHNLPMVRHQGGIFAFLDCLPNLPMAAFEHFSYQEQTLQLLPGDELFLYTDGVTEATSSSLELFGDDRLFSFLNTMSPEASSTSLSICEHTLWAVQQFTTGAEQSDDITMLSFKYHGMS